MKDHHYAFLVLFLFFVMGMVVMCMPQDNEAITVPETATEQSRTIPLL